MVSETYEFQSNFSRRKIADAAGDVATARAEDVLTVLEERGLAVSGEERERITGSADSGRARQVAAPRGYRGEGQRLVRRLGPASARPCQPGGSR